LEPFILVTKIKICVSKILKSLEDSNIKILPFDKKVLTKSFELPKEIDIHDRIIVATAITTNSQLVTKDKVLRSAFPVEKLFGNPSLCHLGHYMVLFILM